MIRSAGGAVKELIVHTTYHYVALTSILCVLLWIPYIGARAFLVWGIPTFLRNYPENYPRDEPPPPLWALRSKRAHLNLVETLPALLGVVLAASALIQDPATQATVGTLTGLFFWARLTHAGVYTLGVPYLRTPVYLVSWGALLGIGGLALAA